MPLQRLLARVLNFEFFVARRMRRCDSTKTLSLRALEFGFGCGQKDYEEADCTKSGGSAYRSAACADPRNTSGDGEFRLTKSKKRVLLSV